MDANPLKIHYGQKYVLKKLTKIWVGDQNFSKLKVLPDEFVDYSVFTKVRQSSRKICLGCRKFRRQILLSNFCVTRYNPLDNANNDLINAHNGLKNLDSNPAIA